MGKMNKYDKSLEMWNQYFLTEDILAPIKKETGNETFDRGLKWLVSNAKSVLDFGCGSGTALFLCNNYGTKTHMGIDLSSQAIKNAVEKSRNMEDGNFQFICGGVEKLKDVQDEFADAVILSNIIDNLYPEDAISVLEEIRRILKKGGKLLVKLNPYITDEQIEEYGIKKIGDNLLDDGMILWNNTNEMWISIFQKKYSIIRYEEIIYEEYAQMNRMYLLERRSQ